MNFHTNHITDITLGNPLVWGPPVLEILTLRDKTWLAGSILNFHLLHHWIQTRHNAQMHFVDMSFTTSGYNLPTQEEITSYSTRNIHADPIPMRPVVLVVHHSHHYFATVFDYEQMAAYVFGSKITLSGFFFSGIHWEDWRGPDLWAKVAALHGWERGDSGEVSVFARQWIQV